MRGGWSMFQEVGVCMGFQRGRGDLSSASQQRLHFLRRLKRASLPPPILTTFYRGTIESVLTSCITVWYGNCSAADNFFFLLLVNVNFYIY